MTQEQNYALSAMKDIRESFLNGVQTQLEVYQDNRCIDFYNTSEVVEAYNSLESLSGFKKLGNLETPPTLSLEEGYRVMIEEERYGAGMTLPENVWLRAGSDYTTKIDQYLIEQRNQLMKESVNYLLTDAFSMYNDAFNGDAFLAPDTKPICGIHNWKSGGSFNNKTTAQLSMDAIDAAHEYAGDFTAPGGKPMPLNFDTIIVKKGSPNSIIAKQLFAFGISPTKVGDINIYEGTMNIIETPYITGVNKNFWFLRDSSLKNSLVFGIGKYPSMNEPITEKNQAIYSSITAFWKRGVVNLPYDIYGSDGSSNS